MTQTTERTGRARKATGEFVIIVLGVLVALAVDSWWQGLEERERETQYLAQLLNHAEENARVLGKALAEETSRDSTLASIVGAQRGSTSIPQDSATVWLGKDPLSYSDPRLRLGTLDALLSTGDFRVIRDARTRSALISYSGQIRADLVEVDRWTDETVRLVQQLLELELEIFFEQSGEWTEARRDVLIGGRGDIAIAGPYGGTRTAVFNRALYLERMAAATNDLLQVLRNPEEER
jgi:hypothetical protein